MFDAAVFMAPPLAGLLLAWKHNPVSNFSVPELCLYLAAIYLMAIHVFIINDLTDGSQERQRLKKNNKETIKDCLSYKQRTIYCIITAALALFSLMLFSLIAFLIGLMLLLLSMMYNTPWIGIHGKGTPVISSLLHILGGALAFLLGFVYFDVVDWRAIITGITFGTFLAAGHLVQEAQDRISDHKNGVKTLTVWLGKKSGFISALLLFVLSHALIQYLIKIKYLPSLTCLNIIVLLLVFLLGVICFLNKLDSKYIKLFRMSYRVIYFLFGLIILYKII